MEGALLTDKECSVEKLICKAFGGHRYFHNINIIKKNKAPYMIKCNPDRYLSPVFYTFCMDQLVKQKRTMLLWKLAQLRAGTPNPQPMGRTWP